MCLQKVTYPHRITHGKAIGLGFKSGVNHLSLKASKVKNKLAKPGVWYTCDDINLEDNCDTKYKGGFHILLTAKDANNYQVGHDAVYLVEYSGILHIGTQFLYSSSEYVPCVIAEKIRYIGKANKGTHSFFDLKTNDYIGMYK